MKNGGYSNFMAHIKQQHPQYLTEIAAELTDFSLSLEELLNPLHLVFVLKYWYQLFQRLRWMKLIDPCVFFSFAVSCVPF
jgi:hypothetical protein